MAIIFSSRLDPTVYMSSISIIVGQLFSWVGWYGINQSAVQRYCGMPTARKGQMLAKYVSKTIIS